MNEIVKRLHVTAPNVELNAAAAAEIERLCAALVVGHTFREFCPTPTNPNDRDAECLACAALGPSEPKPMTQRDIAVRLRKLADDMDQIAVAMDYFGGFAHWSQHGREMAGAGEIAREWADEILVGPNVGIEPPYSVGSNDGLGPNQQERDDGRQM